VNLEKVIEIITNRIAEQAIQHEEHAVPEHECPPFNTVSERGKRII